MRKCINRGGFRSVIFLKWGIPPPPSGIPSGGLGTHFLRVNSGVKKKFSASCGKLWKPPSVRREVFTRPPPRDGVRVWRTPSAVPSPGTATTGGPRRWAVPPGACVAGQPGGPGPHPGGGAAVVARGRGQGSMGGWGGFAVDCWLQ